ncbi:MAG TPA: hypothetical protein PLP26_15095 [Ilumatobacteraceae bacterium]|nr:hypothetical protein [Ilumatobacteraceae bacterium]
MPQDQPSPSNGGRNVALAVMAVIALGGAGLVAYLVTSSNDDARSVAPASTFTVPTVSSFDSLPVIPVITLPPSEEPTTVPATVPATVVVETTVAPATTVAVVEPVNLFSGTQAADVIAQIGVARGAAPLRILQAIIYPGYAFAQVQDPSIPANVDEYQWRDTLGSPSPVTLMGDGDLEANLFSDTDVNWTAIPALVDAALAQIPIEGAEVTHVFVQRNLPFTDIVQIRVFVNGTRGSGYLDADAQGNILAVNTG